jgi:hypothetical protein
MPRRGSIRYLIGLIWFFKKTKARQSRSLYRRVLSAPVGKVDEEAWDGLEFEMASGVSTRHGGRQYRAELPPHLDPGLKFGVAFRLLFPGPGQAAAVAWFFLVDVIFSQVSFQWLQLVHQGSTSRFVQLKFPRLAT